MVLKTEYLSCRYHRVKELTILIYMLSKIIITTYTPLYKVLPNVFNQGIFQKPFNGSYSSLLITFIKLLLQLLFQLIKYIFCAVTSIYIIICPVSKLVSWSLTSLFSTNMDISETNGHSLQRTPSSPLFSCPGLSRWSSYQKAGRCQSKSGPPVICFLGDRKEISSCGPSQGVVWQSGIKFISISELGLSSTE